MDSIGRAILDASRRGLLGGAAGLGALAAIGPWPRRGLAQPGARDPFTLGVASGDPWPDSVVIWTRLAPDPLAPEGGMPRAPVEVTWEVAADAHFATIARRGAATARPDMAHAVHVEVGGLTPGRPWFYRFRAGAHASPVGRTRTAPAPGAAPARLRFVNAGCQHYEHGHFTAWRHIAAEPDLDFVFHYGDFIYETRGRRPGSRGWGPVVRSHLGEETVTLAQYRQRYAQYRLDPDLAAAQAGHPFLISYDDHEVENNWAGPHSENDGSARRPNRVTPEQFALRKAAAFQAWFEHMPLRASAIPRGTDITAYRRLRYGTLAEVHVLDTRRFRDDQPCGDVTAPPCEAVSRPDAQMLGPAQEAWLLDGLGASRARWTILAQQVPLMRRILRDDRAISMDKWDAYPAARERLLRGMLARRVANPVVLSGDVHVAMAATVGLADGPPVATEFVGTSITSEGDGYEETAASTALSARNPHIAFLNGRRGYTLHEADARRMEARFIAVPAVTSPGGAREERARFVVEAGRVGLHRA